MTHSDQTQPESNQPQADQVKTAIITINHPLGLHLRKGKDVVQTASRFGADITAKNLSRQSPTVDAKSILQLMQIQARQGHVVRLSAIGSDAQDALNALSSLFDHRYYDVPEGL